MAAQEKEDCESVVQLHAGRFVYDVMVQTLPKCGYPEEKLPLTNFEDNHYNLVNFEMVAAASALRVSLIMRDKWRKLFINQRNSSGFNDKNFLDFLIKVALTSPLSHENVLNSLVELFLALGNEILLFFYHENIDMEFNKVIHIISLNIMCFIIINPDHQVNAELLVKFENIYEYTIWITDFIRQYAVPYGARNDVSEMFFEHVRKQYEDDLKSISCPDMSSLTKLSDQYRFLPRDLLAIVQESVPLFRNSVLASVSAGVSQSQKLPTLPSCSKNDDLERREFRERKSTSSTNVSEQTAQEVQSSQSADKKDFEEDFERMSLNNVEASTERPVVV